MTIKEFSEAIGRPCSTISLWLRQGRIAGAYLLEVGAVRVWQIPATALQTFKQPKPGRPAKTAKKGRARNVN